MSEVDQVAARARSEGRERDSECRKIKGLEPRVEKGRKAKRGTALADLTSVFEHG